MNTASSQLRAFVESLLRWVPKVDGKGKVEIHDYDLGIKLQGGRPLVELVERQEAVFAALERANERQGRLITQLLSDHSALLDIAAGQFYHSPVAEKVYSKVHARNPFLETTPLAWHQLDAVQKTPYVDRLRKRVRCAQA